MSKGMHLDWEAGGMRELHLPVLQNPRGGSHSRAMLATLTMTIIAADRPGLVQRVASCVAAHEGNWLESRMCRLGGQFAGIVRVEAPQERMAVMTEALRGLASEGMQLVVHAEAPSPEKAHPGILVHLDIVGHDRPGIVREITAVLAYHGVNVEEFSSERADAPMDGSSLFQAKISVRVPPAVALPTLRSSLEKIAADLMVDVVIKQT